MLREGLPLGIVLGVVGAVIVACSSAERQDGKETGPAGETEDRLDASPSDPAGETEATADTGTSGSKQAEVDDPGLTTTPSGLKYKDLAAGSGDEADHGEVAVVHYTGWLVDGTKFDSSLDRGEPFEFPLGGGRVIKGWDEGVVGMKVGGKRRLVIPPDLGYGAAGAPGAIPPNATLIFEVELLEVKPG